MRAAIDEFFPILLWPRVVLWLHKFLTEGAMGTVGLSFGSPTSGAGFDVSSTVAEIVGNLQNVETPWKTQLTSSGEPGHGDFESGNAVFQSLERHERADRFSGDPVAEGGLKLRHECADADRGRQPAVAGTHTVTVTNLAQTSSGYLAPVTNASDDALRVDHAGGGRWGRRRRSR